MNLFSNLFNNKPYPFGIKGLKLIEINRGSNLCRIDTSVPADYNQIEALVEKLPENLAIDFWDNKYPSPTDPGCSVKIRHYKGKFIHYLANHGWHSFNYITSKEYLVNYLLKNWPFNSNLIRISKDPREIELESLKALQFWNVQLTQVLKIDNIFTLYEVNGSYLLSVKCEDPELTEINVIIDTISEQKYNEGKTEVIHQLAEKIRKSPEKQQSSHVLIKNWGSK